MLFPKSVCFFWNAKVILCSQQRYAICPSKPRRESNGIQTRVAAHTPPWHLSLWWTWMPLGLCSRDPQFFNSREFPSETVAMKTKFLHLPVYFPMAMGLLDPCCPFRSTFCVLLYLYLTNKGKCWKTWIRIFKVLPTGLMYPKAVILVLPQWVWLDVLYEIWIKALYYILYFNFTNQKKHDFLFFWFHDTICSWFSSYFYT